MSKRRCNDTNPSDSSTKSKKSLLNNDKIIYNKPFSEKEINGFIINGYITLKNAFSNEIAIKCREQLWLRLEKDGIQQEDPSTWVYKHGISEIFKKEMGYPWNQIFTDRFYSAINQLCGKNKWKKEDLGVGWWIITFPGYDDPPWKPIGKWHIDGGNNKHSVKNCKIGLIVMILFSTVLKNNGGTAVLKGSHLNIIKNIYNYETIKDNNKSYLTGGTISYLFRKNNYTLLNNINNNVVNIDELYGNAGDIFILHPFLLHARSKNLSKINDINSVRFLCNPVIQLKESLNIISNNNNKYINNKDLIDNDKELLNDNYKTPIEKAMIKGIISDNSLDLFNKC